jgi:Domain of unknown function (DUF4159)
MRSLLIALVGGTIVLTTITPLPAAPKEEPLAKRVNDTIQLGVQFLRDRGARGNWEEDPKMPGGFTALAMLALLNAGVPPDDPFMKKGLDYLRDVPSRSTYVVSLQTMVMIQAGHDIDKPRIRQNVDWLLAARKKNGWGYGPDQNLGQDNSNTQYALLALHEAIQAGFLDAETNRTTLKAIQDYYIHTQRDGGWTYRIDSRPGPTLTMTTAGLCGLYITGMDLNVGKAQLRRDGSAVNCGQYDENPNVAQAIAWLSRRFPSRLTEQSIRANQIAALYYALYGLERAGRLSGQRYLGGQDWYRIGCEYLVSEQNSNGCWVGEDRIGDTSKVVSTSFALLFLAKGRTPVLLTKLAYGPPEHTGWNNKRNDIRNLAEFASRELFKKQPMAWQVFDVRTKSADSKAARRELAEELLQSPIVFFNGHTQAPRDKEEEILQEYVDNGGFILAEACCGQPGFDRDFRQLMKRMFPDNELMELPPNHPVWTASGKYISTPGAPFPLYGIQHGCKTVVMYSPQAISGYWEANQFKDGNGQKAFELAANIIAYATGLTPPKPKLTEVNIVRDNDKASNKRGYLQVYQLRHEGDWQPAPKAMRNLMSESRKLGLDVILETKEAQPTVKADLKPFGFFYMHGRRAFSSNAADLAPLRSNLETGGLLLADACCGSAEFDKAFHQFIDELFEKKLKLEDIPPDDDLLGSKLNGEKLDDKKTRCRREAGKPYNNVAPALQGVKYEGRWIVIYSKYDLGCALEHANTPDCLGYDYDSAVKIGRAAVLYHLRR